MMSKESEIESIQFQQQRQQETLLIRQQLAMIEAKYTSHLKEIDQKYTGPILRHQGITSGVTTSSLEKQLKDVFISQKNEVLHLDGIPQEDKGLSSGNQYQNSSLKKRNVNKLEAYLESSILGQRTDEELNQQGKVLEQTLKDEDAEGSECNNEEDDDNVDLNNEWELDDEQEDYENNNEIDKNDYDDDDGENSEDNEKQMGERESDTSIEDLQGEENEDGQELNEHSNSSFEHQNEDNSRSSSEENDEDQEEEDEDEEQEEEQQQEQEEQEEQEEQQENEGDSQNPTFELEQIKMDNKMGLNHQAKQNSESNLFSQQINKYYQTQQQYPEQKQFQDQQKCVSKQNDQIAWANKIQSNKPQEQQQQQQKQINYNSFPSSFCFKQPLDESPPESESESAILSRELQLLFFYYSSLGDKSNISHLKSTQFAKIIIDCKLQIHANTLDLLFLKAAQIQGGLSKSQQTQQQRSISFDSFLGLLSAISKKLFESDFSRFHEICLFPLFNQILEESEIGRAVTVFQGFCDAGWTDLIISPLLAQQLHTLYEAYINKRSSHCRNERINLQDQNELLRQLGFMPTLISFSSCNLIWLFFSEIDSRFVQIPCIAEFSSIGTFSFDKFVAFLVIVSTVSLTKLQQTLQDNEKDLVIEDVFEFLSSRTISILTKIINSQKIQANCIELKPKISQKTSQLSSGFLQQFQINKFNSTENTHTNERRMATETDTLFEYSVSAQKDAKRFQRMLQLPKSNTDLVKSANQQNEHLKFNSNYNTTTTISNTTKSSSFTHQSHINTRKNTLTGLDLYKEVSGQMKTEESLFGGVDIYKNELKQKFDIYKDEKTGAIKLTNFNKLIKDSQLDSVIPRSASDLIFSKCKDGRYNYLNISGFLRSIELLCAQLCYPLQLEPSDVSEYLHQFVQEFILPLRGRQHTLQETLFQLRDSEDIQIILKNLSGKLKPIFEIFSEEKQKDSIGLKQLLQFCQEFELYPDLISSKRINNIWNLLSEVDDKENNNKQCTISKNNLLQDQDVISYDSFIDFILLLSSEITHNTTLPPSVNFITLLEQINLGKLNNRLYQGAHQQRAFSIRSSNKLKNLDILADLRQAHPKFFSQTGFHGKQRGYKRQFQTER